MGRGGGGLDWSRCVEKACAQRVPQAAFAELGRGHRRGGRTSKQLSTERTTLLFAIEDSSPATPPGLRGVAVAPLCGRGASGGARLDGLRRGVDDVGVGAAELRPAVAAMLRAVRVAVPVRARRGRGRTLGRRRQHVGGAADGGPAYREAAVTPSGERVEGVLGAARPQTTGSTHAAGKELAPGARPSSHGAAGQQCCGPDRPARRPCGSAPHAPSSGVILVAAASEVPATTTPGSARPASAGAHREQGRARTAYGRGRAAAARPLYA
eukprot:scaffold2611_cov356-Prasinococcus_capsulatus_cf.AAC.4